MTRDPLEQRMRELSWRSKISPTETAQLEAWLAARPEAQTEWETEAGLTELLERLPPAPVASNFTARVLQAVELAEAADERQKRRQWSWPWLPRWLPKFALAAVVVGVGLFSYERVVVTQREEIARSVLTVSEVAAVASPEVLANLEVIQASHAPPPDVELLALFQ